MNLLNENVSAKPKIAKLSDNILVTVFSYLDKTSLGNILLVDKRFNTIVSTSKILMKKFQLVFHHDWKDEEKSIMKFVRNYTNIKFENIVKWDVDLIKVINHHSAHVTELEFLFCKFTRHNSLYDILNQFLNLNKISFIFVTLDFPFSRWKEIKSVQLPKLKTVVLIDSSWVYLRYLQNSKITCLKVWQCCFNEKAYMIEFLGVQENLKTLVFSAIAPMLEIFGSVAKKFQLKKLSLMRLTHDSDYEEKKYNEELLKFLMTQTEAIELLELEDGQFSEDIYKLVFTKFEALKILKLATDDVPKDDTFYKSLKSTNGYVKELIVDGNFESLYITKQILGHFELVETLRFINIKDGIGNDILLFIAQELLLLDNLYVPQLTDLIFAHVQFPTLKHLHVDVIENMKKWPGFAKNNPCLESLSIGCVENNKTYGGINEHDILEIAIGLKRLKHLKLGNYFMADKKTFETIQTHCHKLMSFEMIGDNVNLELKKKGIKMLMKPGFKLILHDSMKHIFPEQTNLWSEENTKYDLFETEISIATGSSDNLYYHTL